MGWFGRRRTAATVGRDRRQEVAAVREHLEEFVRTRRGVEAFMEPATAVTPTTILLVATTGEWTRRRVGDLAIVHSLAEGMRVPVYDVQLVGYPQRMRDWNQRQRAAQEDGGSSATS